MKTITSFFPVKKSKVSQGEKNSSTKRATSSDDTTASSSYSSSSAKRIKQVAPQVQELISLLHDDDDDDDESNEQAQKNSWSKALCKHLNSSSFEQLAKFVAQERLHHTIYPKPADTFAALTMTPLDQVKVVIVGQDPYHGPGQAHGLCFSVLPGQAVPPSLKNVYQELRDDPAVDFPRHGTTMPTHGHLSRWAKQGVLLLNTVLTVRRGQAHSHKNRGWELVTDEILRAVDKHCRQEQHKGVVFLLWGKPAATKAQALISSSHSSRHTIITTSHPSPLGARKTNKPFMGSRCFSRCNEALVAKGYKPIDWNVDGPLEK